MNQQTHAGKRLTWRTGSLTVALLGLGFVVLTLGLFSSCAKKMALEGGLDSAKMPASVEPAAAPRMEAEMAGEAASDPSAAMSIPFGSAAYAAEITRQIIYSADLTVEVQDVDVAAGSLESRVEAAGGWVSQKVAVTSRSAFRWPNSPTRTRPSASAVGLCQRASTQTTSPRSSWTWRRG